MAGKKGRSGRKSWDKELELKKLWDLSIPVLKKGLTSPNTKPEKQLEIALVLVTKMIPKDLNVAGEGFQSIVHNIISYKPEAEKVNEIKDFGRLPDKT